MMGSNHILKQCIYDCKIPFKLIVLKSAAWPITKESFIFSIESFYQFSLVPSLSLSPLTMLCCRNVMSILNMAINKSLTSHKSRKNVKYMRDVSEYIYCLIHDESVLKY